MKKTIILSENQLKSLIEFTNYLGDKSEFNEKGNSEITADGNNTDGKKGKPKKTRDIAKKLAPQNANLGPMAAANTNGKYARGVITCSKKKTLSEAVGDKKGEIGGNKTAKNMNFVIPGKILDELKSKYTAYLGDENAEGYKRLQFIINSNGHLKYGEMIRLKNYFCKGIDMDTTSGKIAYENLCGDKLKRWVVSSLNNVSKLNKVSNKTV